MKNITIKIILIRLMFLLFLIEFVISFNQKTRFRSSFSTISMNFGVNDPIRGPEWAKRRGMEPGYGGIWPGDPDAKKYSVTIRSKTSGTEYKLQVPRDRYIYFYFEEQGIELPICNIQRMCRQVKFVYNC